jgi:hypothetical protein
VTLTDEFGTQLASYDFCREDEKTLKLLPITFEQEPNTIIVLQQ